jgi:hypothetical protein
MQRPSPKSPSLHTRPTPSRTSSRSSPNSPKSSNRLKTFNSVSFRSCPGTASNGNLRSQYQRVTHHAFNPSRPPSTAPSCNRRHPLRPLWYRTRDRLRFPHFDLEDRCGRVRERRGRRSEVGRGWQGGQGRCWRARDDAWGGRRGCGEGGQGGCSRA